MADVATNPFVALSLFVAWHTYKYSQGFQYAPTANKMHRLLCSYRLATFFEKEEATSLKNVVNKKYVIKSE